MITSPSFAANPALFSAYSDADFFGKCIFFGLFCLSIICWVVLIQKTLQMRRTTSLTSRYQEVLAKNGESILSVNMDKLPKMRGKSLHPYARIFQMMKQKTLEILNKNHFFAEAKSEPIYLTRSDLELVESHAFIAISSEAKRLEKNLFILSTIVSLAPFLGLLGTVWGILVTFSELQAGGTVSSNSAILGGLSTALATTVMGLLIAIPALISSKYLKSCLRHFSSDMEDFLYALLSKIELQYRKP